ncbi:hypothetical protein FB451DRAFT_1180771 [Mycena latifolia]|nr:hypothetical protein FB451DRAFT_1180771 [Mycena latifolia]
MSATVDKGWQSQNLWTATTENLLARSPNTRTTTTSRPSRGPTIREPKAANTSSEPPTQHGLSAILQRAVRNKIGKKTKPAETTYISRGSPHAWASYSVAVVKPQDQGMIQLRVGWLLRLIDDAPLRVATSWNNYTSLLGKLGDLDHCSLGDDGACQGWCCRQAGGFLLSVFWNSIGGRAKRAIRKNNQCQAMEADREKRWMLLQNRWDLKLL